MKALSLFPTCVLPGCTQMVPETGGVCDECVEVFGECLAFGDGPGMTEEQIEARDKGTAELYRAMREIAANPIPEPRPEPELERKRNQTCWLCEERRTCTQMPMGWECDTCKEIEP